MSDSDNDNEQAIDKEQLHKIEQNDIKVDKKAKRLKRLANRDIKEAEEGSEAEASESEKEEGASADEADAGKKDKKDKKTKEIEHAPLVKDRDQLKRSQFMGEKFGHFKIGTYMRIEVQIDKEISRKLEPTYPVVMCSLKHQETGLAFLRVKLKKHRWYPHVLKNKDPLTMSIGWRKF
jgi:ribosome biogenesis protein BMS1